MTRSLGAFAAAGVWLLAISGAPYASAQQSGGILKIGHFDSPASMSMHEESTNAVNRPMSAELVTENCSVHHFVNQNAPEPSMQNAGIRQVLRSPTWRAILGASAPGDGQNRRV